jgi:hypothetical protein
MSAAGDTIQSVPETQEKDCQFDKMAALTIETGQCVVMLIAVTAVEKGITNENVLI